MILDPRDIDVAIKPFYRPRNRTDVSVTLRFYINIRWREREKQHGLSTMSRLALSPSYGPRPRTIDLFEHVQEAPQQRTQQARPWPRAYSLLFQPPDSHTRLLPLGRAGACFPIYPCFTCVFCRYETFLEPLGPLVSAGAGTRPSSSCLATRLPGIDSCPFLLVFFVIFN